MQIRRILVATDYSQVSRTAIDAAIDIARPFAAHVFLLHAWQLPPYVLPEWIAYEPDEAPQPVYVLARTRAVRAMDAALAELRRSYHDVDGRPEQGDPAEVIVAASAREFDLLVLSTHGRTGLSRMWSGSIAESVVRRASCPVLTVRAGEVTHA